MPNDDLEKHRRRLRDMFLGSDDPVSGAAEYLMGLASVPQSAPDPQPATVSGSDVVGLGRDGTEHLMAQMQQQNQFEAQMAREQQRAHERGIDGLNKTLFRAKDLERQRKEREAEKEQARSDGHIVGSRGSGYDRIYPNSNGEWKVQPIQDAQPRAQQPKYVTVPGPDGKPMMRAATPEEITQGVYIYEKPANAQLRDYNGMGPDGHNYHYRDHIDPVSGKTLGTETVGKVYVAPAKGTAITPYQQEQMRFKTLGSVDKLIESGVKDRQVLGDMLHHAGYDDKFINTYLDEKAPEDNSWMPMSNGEQTPYASPQDQGAQPAAAAGGQQQLAPGEFVGADGGVYRDDGDGYATRVR